MKSALVLGAMLLGAVLCSAQRPLDEAQITALNQAADQFVQRLHQTLDVGAADMFAPELAALNREYPGEFAPFDTPRMSLSLLKQTDNDTLRRKLFADWNLHYWTSALAMSNPAAGGDRAKALPPEFLKAAKKSQYLKWLTGTSGQLTLISPQELTGYLTEAEQLGGILKKYLKPEMLTAEPFRSAAEKVREKSGQPRTIYAVMGFNQVYAVGRDAMSLVMIEKDGQYKLITLAPLPD